MARKWRETVINVGLIFCVLGGFFLSIVIFCIGVWAGTVAGADWVYENLNSMDDAEIVIVVREAAKRSRGMMKHKQLN